jgi:hypothetical protein
VSNPTGSLCPSPTRTAVTRWGPDEPNPTEIPGDLTFGTSIPGGFKDLLCSLLRRIDIDYADQALFDTVRVYGARQPDRVGRADGAVPALARAGLQQITPGAVGWSAHLEDFPAFREIYVDRDPSHWGDAMPSRSARGPYG